MVPQIALVSAEPWLAAVDGAQRMRTLSEELAGHLDDIAQNRALTSSAPLRFPWMEDGVVEESEEELQRELEESRVEWGEF